MDGEIEFGLLAALGWGTGDFLAKISTDRIGYLRTALFMQILSGIFLLFFSIPDFPRLWQNPLATGGAVLLGIVSLTGLLSFYKGFQIGRLSIVSPIVSGYPALTSILAVLVLGELLSSGRVAGIIVTLAGVLLVSIQRFETRKIGSPLSSGVFCAIASFILFGVLYFSIKLVVVPLGVWLPILILRWVSGGVLAVSLTASRHGFPLPSSGSLRIVGLVAVLDTFGNIAFNLGVTVGSIAVVSTLSGLFSAVTIGLARIVLHERLETHQFIGVIAVLSGVVLIGYFG